VAPLPDGRIAWFATLSAPEGAHRDADLATVARYFRGWHDPIQQLLRVTPPEALLRHDIYHLWTPLPGYVHGRVALVGDAAHAVTPDLGQGACLALEGAVTLSELAGTESTVGDALAGYEALQVPRAQRIARASAVAGRIAQWRSPVAASLRNAVAWLTPSSVYLRSAAETYSWQPAARH
jgi:2-polyprenyl-6-methoxyphenol hydroxylase-like FAD-dependent oxidoreductase